MARRECGVADEGERAKAGKTAGAAHPAPGGAGGFAAQLLVLVAVVTVLRVLALVFARTDLFFDEAQYWAWAKAPDFGYYSKPPLVAWIIALTTGLFGDGEWAVRLAAPLLHGASALVLGLLGRRLYGGRVGLLAAALFLLLPAVSLSSLLITTDVPLLLAWSAGLLCLHRWIEGDRLADAVLLGLAIGAGLNAKYAMAFFPVLVLLHLAMTPGLRGRLARPGLWLALGLGVAAIVPNLLWNAANAFVTFSHTRDNAAWAGVTLHPGRMAEFVGAQFGVFGPILFAMLLAAAFGRLASGRPAADRFLLVFSVPVLLAFTLQGLLSKANANWGATAYPAATVLVAALLAGGGLLRRRLLQATFGLHGVVAAALLVAPAFAPTLSLPGIGNPFARVLGWREAMAAVGEEARERGVRTLVFTRRADIAAALYYLRGEAFEIAAVPPPPGRPPSDHFQLSRPFSIDLPAPGLLVVPGNDRLPGTLATVTLGDPVTVAVGRGVDRTSTLDLLPATW